MTCEVCGADTSVRASDAPVDGTYFTAVYPGEESGPASVADTTAYEFCSVGHLVAFVAPPGDYTFAEDADGDA